MSEDVTEPDSYHWTDPEVNEIPHDLLSEHEEELQDSLPLGEAENLLVDEPEAEQSEPDDDGGDIETDEFDEDADGKKKISFKVQM